ncbi:MAG: hypothetical protein C4346_10630, partial [Chloroflexota bacterium]
ASARGSSPALTPQSPLKGAADLQRLHLRTDFSRLIVMSAVLEPRAFPPDGCDRDGRDASRPYVYLLTPDS